MRIETLTLVLVLSLLSAAVSAAEKDNKKKTPEEKLKEQIDQKLAGNADSWLPKVGKFHFSPDDAGNDKPLPKVIGTLDDVQGGTFPVMVFEKNTIDLLKTQDNKQVNLMGKLVDGGDKGMIWLTNGPLVASGGAPPARRKRGGL